MKLRTPRPLVLALLAPLLPACAGPQALAGSRPQDAPVRAPLLRAEAPRLAADVHWLADDQREGRRAGTAGEDAARDWIAARLAALGLEPGGEDGTWFAPFDVDLPPRDGGASELLWAWGTEQPNGAANMQTMPVAPGEGYVPLFCSSDERVVGELVWAGYGIVDEEAGRDDYAGLDVEDAVVLVARGAPVYPVRSVAEVDGEGDEVPASPHAAAGPRTEWGASASIFQKVMNAKHRGAAAVLVAQDPLMSRGALPPFGWGGEAKAGLPALMVTAGFAEELFDDDLGYLGRFEALRAGDPEGRTARTPVPTLLVHADVRRERAPAESVLGVLPGRDRSRSVVVGAHYDHLGHGGTGSLAPDRIGEVHNGADDNASGTAAVLELARLFAAEAQAGELPPCDLVFALWSGEELGLLGSAHWTAAPTTAAPRANLNLDMVGRADSGRLQVLGVASAAAFDAWLPEAASRAGLDPAISRSGHGVGGSDHQSFLNEGVPALHLFTGVHSDYHKPSDDAERFEPEGTRRVVEYARFLTRRMAAAAVADALAFQEIELAEEDDRPSRERSWSVWFGSVPDYSGGDGSGLPLSGVQENSPAQRAGLLGGDVLTEVGGVAIDTISDFVYVLQLNKPGNVVLVKYLRDGQEEETRVTLSTRAVQ